MVVQKLPKKFRSKVKRYLDYILDYKRQYKLEEEEVLNMLSENLRYELVAHLNGNTLHNTPVFQQFNILFLSQLTYSLRKEAFTNTDEIFCELQQGQKLYFI